MGLLEGKLWYLFTAFVTQCRENISEPLPVRVGCGQEEEEEEEEGEEKDPRSLVTEECFQYIRLRLVDKDTFTEPSAAPPSTHTPR